LFVSVSPAVGTRLAGCGYSMRLVVGMRVVVGMRLVVGTMKLVVGMRLVVGVRLLLAVQTLWACADDILKLPEYDPPGEFSGLQIFLGVQLANGKEILFSNG
jgi:hypothetical protein